MDKEVLNKMKAIDFLKEISGYCGGFHSREFPKQKASTSELKRWLNSSSVIINGNKPMWDIEIEFPIFQMILFPKSPLKITIM